MGIHIACLGKLGGQTFCAAGDRAADMQMGRQSRAARQDKAAQGRKIGVHLILVFFVFNSLGTVIVGVNVFGGSRLVVFPLMHDVSFPCVACAVSALSTVTGQFTIWLLFIKYLKFSTVGVPTM